MVSANDVRRHGVLRPSLRFLDLIASRTAPCGRCEADPPRDRCRQVSGTGHLKSPQPRHPGPSCAVPIRWINGNANPCTSGIVVLWVVSRICRQTLRNRSAVDVRGSPFRLLSRGSSINLRACVPSGGRAGRVLPDGCVPTVSSVVRPVPRHVSTRSVEFPLSQHRPACS